MSYNCKILKGTHTTYDFRDGLVQGGINDQWIGKIELRFERYLLKDRFFSRLIGIDGDRNTRIYALSNEANSIIEDTLNFSGQAGTSTLLKRVYKNEWYGSYSSQVFREDTHVLFYEPLKCVSFT